MSSRLNYNTEQEYIEEVWDDGLSDLIKDPSIKEEVIVIIDGDFLTFTAAYAGKNPETGERNPEYSEEQYEEVATKLSEMFYKIVNRIEEIYSIEKVYLCLRGYGNFRKSIYKDYKSGRPKPPEIIDYLHKHLVNFHGGLEATGFEADDLVFTIWQLTGDKALIVAVDKDLTQIPAKFWNPMKNKFFKITEQEARYNLAIQMVINDATDGINFTKGWGIKKAQKLINKEMSDYQYMKTILPIYQKIHGEKGKEVMKLAYKLLKLHKIEK